MKTQFDFIQKRFIFFAISICITLAGIIGYFVNGIVWDIDFKGGTSITFTSNENIDNNELQNFVKDNTGQVPMVQKTGSDQKGVSISTNVLSTEQSDKLISAIKEKYSTVAEPNIQNIQPAFGKELVNAALKALIYAVILILLYIIIRFRVLGFKAGLAAIIALVHDVFIMMSVYFIFKIPVNSVFVAAVLTIIGYSINDTIVIYDRIRTNKSKSRNGDLKEIINHSIRQTMTRSIYTIAATVFCTVSILVVAIIENQQLLKDFAFPITIGIISGAYSSIFIASPLWYMMMNKKK